MAQVWLWIGVVGMAIGAAVFGFGAHHARSDRWKIIYLLNFFICLIASGLYLTMALGQGFSIIHDRPTFWVRYVTWFLSTPLLLLDLAYLAGSSLPLTASLIGSNAFMIATGFLATMTDKPKNYIWYIVSCFAYLAVAYLLVQPYRVEAVRKHPRAKKAFTKLLTVHLVLWTLYPVVWILAATGWNVIGQAGEAFGYTSLDLLSKVGFGFLSLNTMSTLEKADEAPSPQYESAI